MSAERGFFRKAAIPKGLWVVLGKTALAAAWLTLALASASAESEQKHPVAGAARIDQGADKAKLVFDLTAEAKAEAFVLANPDRVIIDLPQIDFAIDPDMGKPANSSPRRADLVASFRFGQLAPGKSRIVIDLSAPALVVRASCEKSQTDDHSRLVIELAKTDRANFRNAVQEARAKLAALAQSNATPNSEPASAKPVIVIDPGHGGIDRGARVKGLVEKELVFDFAKSLAAKLEADGHVTVVLTRDGDSFVTLSERVKMARERNAALFLSIHADTLSEADVAGATVYTVSDRASDAEAARVAEKENESDAVAGLDKTEECRRGIRYFVRFDAAGNPRLQPFLCAYLGELLACRGSAQQEPAALRRISRFEGARRPFGALGTWISFQSEGRPGAEFRGMARKNVLESR